MIVIDFKDTACRHCYKCVRYCGVNAIRVENGQARIIQDHCINCGHCLEVCPQHAKVYATDMERIKGYMRQGYKTVVSLAPSYSGILKYETKGQIVDALMKLGFSEVRETAEGAAIVTEEYKRLVREEKMENIITTCCPSVNDMIEKYYPDCSKYMAPVVSPMIAHGRYIKELYGNDCKVVFLGPCIAKKKEAVGDERVFGAVDAVMTFEELIKWLREENIDICECDDKEFGNPCPEINRLYPISSGVIRSVMLMKESDHYNTVFVDGINNCKGVLESLQNGELQNCFIEVNICEGGCVTGPASASWNTTYAKAITRIQKGIEKKHAVKIMNKEFPELKKDFGNRELNIKYPTEEEIVEILKAMDKHSIKDELNCGACGYDTCREKAIAVYQGKASVETCMPYALMRAETMSNLVMDLVPDMIYLVDKDLHIQECNKAGLDFLGVSREEALDRYLFEFIETQDVEEVLLTQEDVKLKKVSLSGGKMIAEETIVYVPDTENAFVMFRDISTREKRKELHYNFRLETLEMAQKVIEKQMMVAQEIAGLLGETTAETKVTLTKLRDSALNDEEAWND
ncbi:MAG: [Fe-Fe] hydrogenase large subunit C-terminal domain-containing protein [Schaedlerella sp.]|nr:[Fe-Fe] hydrogenase large subunit C-terminal domain-containing protein [Schaedlerella sp.]